MAFVRSVKRYTLTLTAGTAAVDTALDDQTAANCVPFVTTRVVTASSTDADQGAYAVDVSFIAGPNVQVETVISATRVVECEVTVVEFIPANVEVQTGTFTINSTAIFPVNIPTDLSVINNTFLYHTWRATSVGTDYGASCVRGNIENVGQLEFSRSDDTGDIDGNWWTVEAIAGTPDFTVQHIAFNMGPASATATPSLPVSKPENKTFLISSGKSGVFGTESFSNAENTADTELTGSPTATALSATRQATDYTRYIETAVVTFDAGNAATVQRGTLSQSAATASEDVDITDMGSGWSDVAMVHTAGETGSFISGSFPGTEDTDCVDAHVAWTFVDSDTIQAQHNTGGGEASQDISWEVILWGDASGGEAPRRVMVIA